MSTVIEDAPETVHIKVKQKTTYVDAVNNIDAIEKMGKWIALSKFFGCDNQEQGCVIAMECFLKGLSPIEYQRANKIVNGKPFMQYDAMLAAFHRMGGESNVLESTPDGARIEFEYKEKTQEVSLTWEELKQEPHPYAVNEKEVIKLFSEGKTPQLKPKYATPRSRQTMILARLISSSLRYICPELVEGVYTEEEVGDIIDAESTDVTPKDQAEKDERRKRLVESKKVEAIEALQEVKQEPVVSAVVEKAVLETDAKSDEVVEAELAGPVSPELVEAIKTEISKCWDDGLKDYRNIVIKKLQQHGYSGLAELRTAEAEFFLQAVKDRNIALIKEAALIRKDELPF